MSPSDRVQVRKDGIVVANVTLDTYGAFAVLMTVFDAYGDAALCDS